MAEYIEREAAITTALDAVEIHPSQIGCLKEALREIPAADVRSVVRGQWNQNEELAINMCSECGYSFSPEGYIAFFNFCPNCGADMRR